MTNEQKRRVCMLAREAWDKAGRPGFADQADDTPAQIRISQTEAFEMWRHAEQAKSTGCLHLTCSENRLFPLLMAHFARLAGRAADAEYWADRTVGDPQRQAMFALKRTFDQAKDLIGNPREYCAEIARSKFRTTDLESLSERQIWTLVFDMRRATQKRRAKCLVEAPF